MICCAQKASTVSASYQFALALFITIAIIVYNRPVAVIRTVREEERPRHRLGLSCILTVLSSLTA
jgi:flagellar biosynthesis/type III secretory pathway M-ring protein FliF/YscJ